MKSWNECIFNTAIAYGFVTNKTDYKDMKKNDYKSPHLKDCMNKFLGKMGFPKMRITEWVEHVEQEFISQK